MINIENIQQAIRYKFNNPSLLRQAFTHDSYANQNGEKSYERLEFLGDKKLDAYISEKLYKLFPNASEKELTEELNRLTNGATQTQILGNLHGISKSIQAICSVTDKIKEDVLEAIIGAVYLDGGEKTMEAVIEVLYKSKFKKLEARLKTTAPHPVSAQILPAPQNPFTHAQIEKMRINNDNKDAIIKNDRGTLAQILNRTGLTFRYSGKKPNVRIVIREAKGQNPKVVWENTEHSDTKNGAATKAVEFLHNLLEKSKSQGITR